MAARYSTPIGKRFGSLVVLGDAPRRENGLRRVLAQCDCGSISDVLLYNVTGGHTRSCGCQASGATHRHSVGGAISRTYSTWRAMKARCLNARHPGYAEYGGRGITICERWVKSFENFLADMGERPDRMTLDRFPDVDGNYEPGNCRWATSRMQQNNRRYTVIIEHDGIKKPLSEWAEERGMSIDALYNRIHKLKWNVERALTTPCRSYIRR